MADSRTQKSPVEQGGLKIIANNRPHSFYPPRRENQALLTESFVPVLELAQSLKLLKFSQLTVAGDGPKVLAHASNLAL